MSRVYEDKFGEIGFGMRKRSKEQVCAKAVGSNVGFIEMAGHFHPTILVQWVACLYDAFSALTYACHFQRNHGTRS